MPQSVLTSRSVSLCVAPLSSEFMVSNSALPSVGCTAREEADVSATGCGASSRAGMAEGNVELDELLADELAFNQLTASSPILGHGFCPRACHCRSLVGNWCSSLRSP